MRIGKEQFDLFNQQFQQVSGKILGASEFVKAETSNELLEEFSKILDKIASKVQALKENQADTSWTNQPEFFAAAHVAKQSKAEVSSNADRGTVNKNQNDKKEKIEEDPTEPAPAAEDTAKPIKADKPHAPVCKVDTKEQEPNSEPEPKQVTGEQVAGEEEEVKVDESQAEPVSEEHVTEANSEMQPSELTEDLVDYVVPVTQTPAQLSPENGVTEDVTEELVEEEVAELPDAQGEGTQLLKDDNSEVLNETEGLLADVATENTETGKVVPTKQLQGPMPAAEVMQIDDLPQLPAVKDLKPLPDDFAQQIMQRLMDKFAVKQAEGLKVETPLAQFARLAVELAMPIKVDQQILNSALNQAQNSIKLGSESGISVRPIAAAASNNSNFGGAQTQLNESRANEKQAEAQRLPRNFASRTLQRVEEVLKEVSRTKDGKTISLRLDPPQLGNIRVDVRINEGVLTARLRAENPQVALLLREHGLDLQGALRRIGLNVDDIRVSVSSDVDGEHNFDQFFNERQTNQDRDQFNWDTKDLNGLLPDQEQQSANKNQAVDHWVA